MASRQQAAKDFAEFWQGKGYEKGQSQPFWLSLLRDVYGVEHPERYITFEDQVHLDHTSFIDGNKKDLCGKDEKNCIFLSISKQIHTFGARNMISHN